MWYDEGLIFDKIVQIFDICALWQRFLAVNLKERGRWKFGGLYRHADVICIWPRVELGEMLSVVEGLH